MNEPAKPAPIATRLSQPTPLAEAARPPAIDGAYPLTTMFDLMNGLPLGLLEDRARSRWTTGRPQAGRRRRR